MPLPTFNLTGSWTVNSLAGVGTIEIAPVAPEQADGYLLAETMLKLQLVSGAISKNLVYFPGTKLFVSERIANRQLNQYIVVLNGSDINLNTCSKEPIN